MRSLLAAFLLAAPAHAATLDGMPLEDTLVVDGETLYMNGAGLRAVPIIGIGIYVAALYLPAPSHDAAAILAAPVRKAVVLHFLHGASRERVQEQFRHGEQVNCGDGGCDQAALPDFERLVQATPAIAAGDTAAYVYDPARLRVYANGRLIGDYPDAALSRQLLAGFLGAHPPTKALKRQLLGLPGD